MKGSVHLLSGFIIGSGIIIGSAYAGHLISPEYITPMIGACVLGSIFPDIDNKNSMVGRPMFLLRWYQGTLKHRDKITHTPLFLLISLVFISHLYQGIYLTPVMLGWAAGYLTHLLLDTFTKGGIRWVPFMKRITLLKIPSGAFGETLLMVTLCVPISFIASIVATNIHL